MEAFLWDGTLHHLGGSLGGDFTGAFSVSDTGQAVGFGYLAGDVTFHATLWKQIGKITDLGVLGSDQCSYAADINAQGQVVGSSMSTCDADPTSFCACVRARHGFDWRHSPPSAITAHSERKP